MTGHSTRLMTGHSTAFMTGHSTRLMTGLSPPLIAPGAAGPLAAVANPVPQALVLTAIVIGFTFACFGIALLFNLYRVVIAPGVPDRILALDTMTINMIAILTLFGIREGTEMYFEASLLFAMVGFVSTVAYAKFILRGIRTPSDYEYERSIRYINSDLHPEITTVFLMPPREYTEVSSTMVKGMVGPHGWRQMIRRYVPDAVYDKILKDHENQA